MEGRFSHSTCFSSYGTGRVADAPREVKTQAAFRTRPEGDLIKRIARPTPCSRSILNLRAGAVRRVNRAVDDDLLRLPQQTGEAGEAEQP